MTAEQFESVLEELRRRQGTRRPLVQVATAEGTVRGRVEDVIVQRRNPASPFGIVSIEQPGLVRGPSTLVQIAEIPDDGVHELPARQPALAGSLN